MHGGITKRIPKIRLLLIGGARQLQQEARSDDNDLYTRKRLRPAFTKRDY